MAIKKIPCGGFYVDDGAIQNVDGKPVLSAWNADLPKPSVGGYGYTEQGEQTTIEWDGDTTGKEHFESEGAVLYNVANVPQDFDKDSVSKITETTGETDFAVLDMSEMAGVIAFSYNNSKMLLMVVVDYEKANAIFGDASLTTNGVFFAVNGDVYTTSLTYGTPDTIHKIDEKYLPEAGGGVMVVVPISLNMQTQKYEFADGAIPILDAFKSDFESGKMYPISLLVTGYLGGMPVVATSTITTINSAQGMFTMFAYGFGEGDSGLKANQYMIMNSGGEWSISMTDIG